MPTALSVVLLLIAALSRCAWASVLQKHVFTLLIDERRLSPDERQLAAQLIYAAEIRLPPRVKQSISRPVVISFTALTEERRLPPPHCPLRAGELALPRAEAQLLGRSELASSAARPHHIALHRGFLAAMRNDVMSEPYSCGHRSLYKLALATLLHELIHLYDARAQLSRSSLFLNLQRFSSAWPFLRAHSRNELAARSPDAYEYKSAAESLAVNVEFFLLDPEFRCRRPALYQFFEDALHLRPFPNTACELNTLVPVEQELRDLAPERVYQVHLLLATRGEQTSSRWGHLMFRLVVCAADRKEVGPGCLADERAHVVLSFAADLDGALSISAWKGLFGGYRSMLFLRSFREVVGDYTERQARSLLSYPIPLSDAEKRQFILHALELYWSYAGRYYFLSNNCATEALSLLKGVLGSTPLAKLSALTPVGVTAALLQHGLVRPVPQDAGSEQSGLYFPALRSVAQQKYKALKQQFPVLLAESFEQYLSLRANARRLRFPALARRSAMVLPDLLTIEGAALLQWQVRFDHRLFASLSRAQPGSEEAAVYAKLRRTERARAGAARWAPIDSGYGIPMPSDFSPATRRVTALPDAQLQQDLDRLIERLFAKDAAELAALKSNQSLLKSLVLRAIAHQQ